MSDQQGNVLYYILIAALGSYLLCKFSGKDLKEYFSEEESLKMESRTGSACRLDATPYKPRNVSEDGGVYSRPTFVSSDRFTSDRMQDKIKGPVLSDPLDIMQLANMASSISDRKPVQDETYCDPLRYVPTNEKMITPNISAMTMGKDPTDYRNFMSVRPDYTVSIRKKLDSSDHIRGDLKIVPNNSDNYNISRKSHMSLNNGVIDIVSESHRPYRSGDFRTMIDGRDTIVSNLGH